MSCRTGALRGLRHFVTGVGLRLTLRLVGIESRFRPTGGPREAQYGTKCPTMIGDGGFRSFHAGS
jgi:hypothetical protein